MSIPDGIPKGWRMYQRSAFRKNLDSRGQHYACFACRKMFNKHITDKEGKLYPSQCKYRDKAGLPCPECGQGMLNMGNGFKPPRRNDIKKWRILERQARAGKRFWYTPT